MMMMKHVFGCNCLLLNLPWKAADSAFIHVVRVRQRQSNSKRSQHGPNDKKEMEHPDYHTNEGDLQWTNQIADHAIR